MTKKLYSIIAALLLCSMSAAAALYQVEDADCRYVLDSSTKKASVQKFIGPSSRKTVTIPDNILSDDGKTYKVTAIDECAFMGSNVVTVNFPTTIKTIGDCAFQDCPRFFKGKSLVLPSGLTSIGMEAFSGCKFTGVTIPASVTSIGESAFSGSSLKSVTFDSRSSNLKIGAFAFKKCTALTSVTLPNKTTSLGQAAFSGCTALASASFPATLTKLPSLCFEDCSALSSFNIASGVTTIGWAAFMNSGVASVSIPATVKKLEQQAFQNSALTSVTLPAAVTAVPYMAFAGCSRLSSVVLPATLTSIESGAFYECNALMTIRCDAVTPPQVNDASCFSANSYAAATLQLPAASVTTYSMAEIWKKFNWFTRSGVEGIEAADAPAEYFTLQGTPVAADALTPGVYVCRRGREVTKIIVR